MRRRIITYFVKRFGGRKGGNLSSLLLTGSTTNGNKEIGEWAKGKGVSHLFALSGMHLAFLSLIVTIPLKNVVGKRKAKGLSFLLCLVFLYVNGMRPSLLRSIVFLSLSYFLSTEEAYALSFPLLMKLFPYLSNDMGVMLGYVSLYGILLVRKKTKGNIFLSSLAALSTSVPFSFHLFGVWAPAALFISVIGGVGVEILFLIIIISIFIPKLECIIDTIYEILMSTEGYSLIPLQYDLRFYPYLLLLTLAFVFFPGLFFMVKGGLSFGYVESQLRQSKRNR